MIGHSLKNMFDSLGFAYDFSFCQNKWSLTIFQNVLWNMPFKNDKIYQSFLGESQQIIKNTKFPFDVFDRYEIHIQAFPLFINGKLIIFRSSSS